MKNLITLIFSLGLSISAIAQQGTINGQVTDATTSEGVIGANVVIAGTSTGAPTDLDGNYSFSAEAGTYTVQVSYIGYKKFIKENVVVSAGQTTTLAIVLEEDLGEELDIIVVTAKADLASEAVLLMDRKEAAIAIESIGASELSAKGVSDVGAGLAKMSGISKVSSRGIFVRGLGDRYNNAYLNGMPLPSPNPTQKVIDLNIIPTSVVRNLEVSKSYRVDQFGDVSGAAIDIYTKDAPSEDYLEVKFGANFNTRTTLRNFITRRNGNSEYLGLGGDGRKGPFAVDYYGKYSFSEQSGDPFAADFGRQQISAPVDNTFGIQGGKAYKWGQNKLGFTAAANFRNSYRADDGANNVLDAYQNKIVDFNRERYAYAANLTGLFGLQYSLSDRHALNINYLVINDSENSYIASRGKTAELDEASEDDILNLRNRYTQTTLHDWQASLKSNFTDRFSVQLATSFAIANTSEPDRQELSFLISPDETKIGRFNNGVSGVNQRYFQESTEKEFYGNLSGSYLLGALDPDGNSPFKIVAGYQYKDKDRSVGFRGFALNLPTGAVDTENIDEILNDATFLAGRYTYSTRGDGSSQSRAIRKIHAGYTYAELNLSDRLMIVPGLRAEVTNQNVYYRRQGASFTYPYYAATVDVVDLLPALSARYNVSDQHIIRASASKTLTRPNFMELIPVPFTNENLQGVIGRPKLQNSEVYNVDLKYDIYPNASELISVGAFYKHIDKPIEQVMGGVNFISYYNVVSANVAGVEFEFSKRISNVVPSSSKLVNGLVVDGNLSLLYSRVNTDPTQMEDEEARQQLTQITNSKRMLQGASPYLANVSIGYDDIFIKNSIESNIKLTYNTFGKRIFSVGAQDRGDEYELSYGTLDLVLQNTWQNGLGIKLAAKNLLNPAIQRQQEAGPNATKGDVLTQSYKAGMNLGVTVTYRLLGRQ